MLARIGTMTMRATTAAMPMTERDQWGCGGILGTGWWLRRPFVKPFPFTRPFVAPRPNERPFAAPVVRPLTRPSATPLTRPFVRPFRVPLTCPFVRPVRPGPVVASPVDCRPSTAARAERTSACSRRSASARFRRASSARPSRSRISAFVLQATIRLGSAWSKDS